MTRAELRLAVGAAAVVDEELPPIGMVRRFAARGPGDPFDGPPTRVVLVHPPPPEGPVRGAMLDRMAAIRAIRHGSLAAPLACGHVAGSTWVVEALPVAPTLADRVDPLAPISVQETVRLLRETARALSALHRAGMTHGVLGAAAVECAPDHVRIHHLGHAHGGSVAADLQDLGRVGWLALVGREATAADRSPRRDRDSVPAALDRLVASLLDPDPAARPISAETVLEALDWFPIQEPTPLRTLIDGAGRGARLPNERRAAIALALVAAALLLIWALTRGG